MKGHAEIRYCGSLAEQPAIDFGNLSGLGAPCEKGAGASDAGVSFVEECLYPDGCRVMSAMTLTLRDGRINEHLTVQAWDEVSCS